MCTDSFVEKVGPLSREDKKGLNITEWFEMNSFDLLGEMAFGQSFGCISGGRLICIPHSL